MATTVTHLTPAGLTGRLRDVHADERVAALLAAALGDALCVALLDEADPAAAARLRALLDDVARNTAPAVLHRVVFDALERLADAPALRERLACISPAEVPA